MLGKFFHTFVLVENARQGGAMRLTIQVIILRMIETLAQCPDEDMAENARALT